MVRPQHGIPAGGFMDRAKGFIRLGIGVAAIWATIFYAVPAFINTVPGYKAYADEVERRGIKISALFYTEVEQAGDAQTYLQNSWRFAPEQPEAGK